MNNFILGGLTVPIEAILNFSQNYRVQEASTLLIMADGTALKQTAWSGKLQTELTGSGWIPTGLDELDYSSPLELSCAARRSILKNTNVIALPAARRSDFSPYGYAISNGRKLSTPVDIVGDTATLTAVAGAQFYQVLYQPKIQVYANPPDDSEDISRNEYSWRLSAREV